MYYLRKEPYESAIEEIKKTDGTFILERKYTTDDRAVYKSTTGHKLYRNSFKGFNNKTVKGLKLYTCKTLKKIMQIRQNTFNYCGEWFDVYDDKGKVKTSSD